MDDPLGISTASLHPIVESRYLPRPVSETFPFFNFKLIKFILNKKGGGFPGQNKIRSKG